MNLRLAQLLVTYLAIGTSLSAIADQIEAPATYDELVAAIERCGSEREGGDMPEAIRRLGCMAELGPPVCNKRVEAGGNWISEWRDCARKCLADPTAACQKPSPRSSTETEPEVDELLEKYRITRAEIHGAFAMSDADAALWSVQHNKHFLEKSPIEQGRVIRELEAKGASESLLGDLKSTALANIGTGGGKIGPLIKAVDRSYITDERPLALTAILIVICLSLLYGVARLGVMVFGAIALALDLGSEKASTTDQSSGSDEMKM